MLGRRQIQGSFEAVLQERKITCLRVLTPNLGGGVSVPFVTSQGAGFTCIFWHMSPEVSLSGRLTDRMETSKHGVESEEMVKASFAVPTSTFPTVFHPNSWALRLKAAPFNLYPRPRPLGGHLGSCSQQAHTTGADAKGSIQRSTEPPTALLFLPENSIRSSCHFQLLRLSRCVVIDPVNIFSCLTTRESSQRQQPVVVYLAPPFFRLSKLCFCLRDTELSQPESVRMKGCCFFFTLALHHGGERSQCCVSERGNHSKPLCHWSISKREVCCCASGRPRWHMGRMHHGSQRILCVWQGWAERACSWQPIHSLSFFLYYFCDLSEWRSAASSQADCTSEVLTRWTRPDFSEMISRQVATTFLSNWTNAVREIH